MIEQVLSGVAALIKETGWKPEYIVWELPCAWFFLLIDFWPVYKPDKQDDQAKNVSEMDKSQLSQLGVIYNG